MKLNKKGFTLIELLAVIVILLAISTIAISSISSAIERNKQKTNNAKKKVLESYGELYFEENINDYTTTNKCVDIGTLSEYFNLEDSEIKDADDKQFKGSIKCKCTYENEIKDADDKQFTGSINCNENCTYENGECN